MVSYAGMAYAACLSGVYASLEYEKRVEKELKKKIPEDGINKIILDYYNIQEEYSYCVGHKVYPEDKKDKNGK